MSKIENTLPLLLFNLFFYKTSQNLDNISVFEFLEKYGEIPLPPYIKRDRSLVEDNNRYQTIYSKNLGAVAAPTVLGYIFLMNYWH